MALTKTDQLILDAMRAFEDAQTLGEQQEAVKRVADVIDSLLAADKSARDWLNNAPIDYSNGVEYGGYDEGNVRGWQGHKEVVKELDAAIARVEPLSVCHDCQGVVQGEREMSDDDGPLCLDCYQERCAERAVEDARWQAGDFLYDWLREG